MSTTLTPSFWDKLNGISSSLGMNPTDLLTVMYFESGLDPAAHNKNGHASGLIQFMPDTLDKLGFSGSHGDFRELDAVNQLDYVKKYVEAQSKFKGSSFTSATEYYVANLWPVALKLPEVKEHDPNAVIIYKNPTVKRFPGVSLEQEAGAYRANSGLDVNNDGKITYGDLDRVMKGTQQSAGFKRAVDALQNKQEITINTKHNDAVKPADETPTNSWAKLDGFLDKFLSLVANKQNILVKISSDNIYNSLEFARILSLALDEELSLQSSIHTDKSNVEISCKIAKPVIMIKAAIKEFSNVLANEFPFELKTELVSGDSNYQELDIKLADLAYRQFHLKFASQNVN